MVAIHQFKRVASQIEGIYWIWNNEIAHGNQLGLSRVKISLKQLRPATSGFLLFFHRTGDVSVESQWQGIILVDIGTDKLKMNVGWTTGNIRRFPSAGNGWEQTSKVIADAQLRHNGDETAVKSTTKLLNSKDKSGICSKLALSSGKEAHAKKLVLLILGF